MPDVQETTTKDVQTTTTNTVLKMVFTLNGGKTYTLTLKSPNRTRTTASAIAAWMQGAIDEDVFMVNNNLATEIKDAYIYETNTIELE